MSRQKITPKKLRKVSIASIKRRVSDVSFLSNDMIIAYIDAKTTNTITQAIAFKGLSAMVMMSGQARMSIDLEEYDVMEHDIVVFSPQKSVKIQSCSDDATAYFTSFSQSFIDGLQVELSRSLHIYMHFDKNPILHLTQDDVTEIRELFQFIKRMIGSNKERFRTEIIKTLLTTIFYIFTELIGREGVEGVQKGRSEIIFDEFLSLLDRYSSTDRNVKFYADKLNISTKYLSAVVKGVSGKTAARWIDEAVVQEAKNLLIYSGLSIQEIASRLNFSTQSFFGKYFKQHTGLSPSRFKRSGHGV